MAADDDSNDSSDLTIVVVVARANENVSQRLLRGAEEALRRHGIEDPEIDRVPTAWDIPVVALALAEKGGPDAIVALGAVIGDDVAALQIAAGLMQVQLDTGVPITLGILATEDEDEALSRSGFKSNKGAEAADAAVEIANLLRQIQG
jgi:6,7-dimethyl-8-ribityllumazine synthase